MADLPNRDAAHWIRALDLSRHPEGGWYRETYRSTEQIAPEALPARYGGSRSHSTCIWFLLAGSDRSLFHRLASDELWHVHDGHGAVIVVIAPDGTLETLRLGLDVEAGERPMAVIPAGRWFGAWVPKPDGFVLVGCTVAPGFDFADFEMADRARLLEEFPQHRAIIERLTNLS